MHDEVRLLAPLELTGRDVERAFFEQSVDEPAVARVFDQLCGAAAERAAAELNYVLELNLFDLLAQGWVKVPAVRTAVLLSALAQSSPAFIKLDQHRIASTSSVVLDSSVAQDALPPLRLALEIAADVQSATLEARAGRIELVALGEASVVARLKYKSVLVKEHATGIARAQGDLPSDRRSGTNRRATVDIQI